MNVIKLKYLFLLSLTELLWDWDVIFGKKRVGLEQKVTLMTLIEIEFYWRGIIFPFSSCEIEPSGWDTIGASCVDRPKIRLYVWILKGDF